MAFYYPEGNFGPVCDLPPTSEQLSYESRTALDENILIDDGRERIFGAVDDWYEQIDLTLGKGRWYEQTRCEIRVLEDGSLEYFNCEDIFSLEPTPFPLPDVYETAVDTIGLRDNFFVPRMSPEACSPYRPDINIKPLKFFQPNGTVVTKRPVEGSSPVTFPVTSENISILNASTITASFDATSSNLVIGGTGQGLVQLRLEWNDNPSINGTAVSNIQIGNTTWTQTGGSGAESHSIQLAVGTYPIIYTGLNAANSPILQNSNTELCLQDGLSNSYMAYVNNVKLARTDGTIENTTLGYPDASNATQYFFPISRAIAEEYTSGRFGRSGSYPNRGRPPDLGGLTGYVDYYLQLGGSLSDNPVNSTIFETVKDLIESNYTVIPFAEGNLADVASVTYPTPDCNAKFTITDVLPTDQTTNVAGYWSEEGNKYAVWTNPAVCTLPRSAQIVTYKIPITEADTYGFTFGCDDTGTLTLGDSSTPLINATGGIFAGGTYNTPYTATASLDVGTLLLTVSCTNSDGGFVDADNLPTGNAYNWQRNPGGWYIKMCKGDVCTSGTSIPWVAAGPHPAWSDFMSTYAVFPSNSNPLLDAPQSATWNINIPTTGNYVFECSADNTATFTLDGTQIATSGSFTSTTSVNLPNLSEGGHTLAVTVTNVTNNPGGNTWTDNPGGVAWRIKYASSNLDANFQSNGDLLVTGAGASDLSFAFAWSDNPNTYSTALGTYALPQLNISFTQNTSTSSGSGSATANGITAGTYAATILNNSGGFTVQNGGKKLCFKDLDGPDCNAEVVMTVSQIDATIASSLDLNTLGDGNLFWHTRKAIGYTYVIE